VSAYTDYQTRATEFSVGDVVFPYEAGSDKSGTIVSVYPAIGMVDVQFPNGSKRYPVEDLQRADGPRPSEYDSVPGGAGSVSLPGGPSSEKVALYWAVKDRGYHATKAECPSGPYSCPKCKETPLKKAIYKRREGASEHLFACPGCMFLIKNLDIHHHSEGM
jgi:hypothetical protein